MLEQNEGRIYLADKRGITAGTKYKRFHTFNDEQYFVESRIPFGALKVLNEEVLAAGEQLSISFNENTALILLPIIGGLSLRFNEGEPEYIVAGEAIKVSGNAGEVYVVENPYSEESISFLQIQVVISKTSVDISSVDTITFNLENNNQLLALGSDSMPIFIGQYYGRREGVYQLKNPENGLFAFVIEGAFEVQNRLLESKDALALWNFREDAVIEFEALSNNAIILLIEVKQ